MPRSPLLLPWTGLPFLPGADGKTLLLRDEQHDYVFTAK